MMIPTQKLLRVTCSTVVPIRENRTMIARFYGDDFRSEQLYEFDLCRAHALAEHLVRIGLQFAERRNAPR
jgi:hypothetical protein